MLRHRGEPGTPSSEELHGHTAGNRERQGEAVSLGEQHCGNNPAPREVDCVSRRTAALELQFPPCLGGTAPERDLLVFGAGRGGGKGGSYAHVQFLDTGGCACCGWWCR